MSLLDNLPHTATAKRRARARAGLGHVDSYATLFEDRACWVQPAGDSEIREFGRRGITVTNSIYFTANPELTEEDVIITDTGTFEVRAAADPDCTAGMGVLFRVTASRTTTGSTP